MINLPASTSPEYVDAEARQALETFVVDNADLETLEGYLDQFNIFDALGIVRQELRHSDFLAFLLDPQQNHGLGDSFVRKLLQRILIANQDKASRVSPVHLDAWDLSHLTVRREWQNIDVLVVDHVNKLVVVFENKIASSEHSNQLLRYLSIVDGEFPSKEWTCLAIYLTPDGGDPSSTDYLPADFGIVADTVDSLAQSRKATLDLAVRELMIHYAQMLRRHIVTDSEIADLCRRIYHRHQRAIDLIFEHRPDQLAEVQAVLVELVRSRDGLILDTASKQVVRFAPQEWELLPKSSSWTRSGRLVLFEFSSYPNRLDLNLWVGPGPTDDRQQLIDLASLHQPPFRVPKGPQGKRFKSIFSRAFLRSQDYEGAMSDDVSQRIHSRWDAFVNHDLPLLILPIQEARDLQGPLSEPITPLG